MSVQDLEKMVEASMTKLSENMNSMFDGFRKTVDDDISAIKKNLSTDETKAVVEKFNGVFDQFDKLKAQAEANEKATENLKGLFDELRTAKARVRGKAPVQGKSIILSDDPEYKKEVDTWLRTAYKGSSAQGIWGLSAEEQKILADVADEAKQLQLNPEVNGGFLAPVEFVHEILRDLTNITAIRQFVRTRRTANKSTMIPIQTGKGDARWVSENGLREETGNPTYGMREVTTHEIYALLDISNQLIEDAAWDMEGEIRRDVVEAFALAEGRSMILGTGVGQPLGLLVADGVTEVPTGSATTITDADGQVDGLIKAAYEVDTFYARNARWFASRRTIGAIRRVKLEDGQYIWAPGIAGGPPATILDAPYTEVPDMPEIAAGTFPLVFGDFTSAYLLVDRLAMEFLRDPYTQAQNGNIRYIFRKRVGGTVLQPKAYVKVKVAAS